MANNRVLFLLVMIFLFSFDHVWAQDSGNGPITEVEELKSRIKALEGQVDQSKLDIKTAKEELKQERQDKLAAEGKVSKLQSSLDKVDECILGHQQFLQDMAEGISSNIDMIRNEYGNSAKALKSSYGLLARKSLAAQSVVPQGTDVNAVANAVKSNMVKVDDLSIIMEMSLGLSMLLEKGPITATENLNGAPTNVVIAQSGVLYDLQSSIKQELGGATQGLSQCLNQ